jgi:hypothetical protein
MPFTTYKNIATVILEFQLTYEENNFIVESQFQIDDYFKSRFERTLKEGIVDNSEYAICENLIAPILREVWFNYSDRFLLWSHQPLIYDEQLSGVPDYLLAKRSPLGKVVFDKPFFVAVEAKKDDFTEGWGQCSAEMVAVQKINETDKQTIFGIVSNGKIWEFGKLSDRSFTKNIKIYRLSDLEELFAAINYVFEQCQLQL